jgi:hypothetical protein
MLLSRRRLVLTDSQMYFQCIMGYGVESLNASLTTTNGPFGALYRVFPHRGIGHSWLDLSRRLVEYYTRQLSFGADIIHAFTGIINAFNDSELFHHKVTHFYGISIIYNDEDLNMATDSFLTQLIWTGASKSRPPRIYGGSCLEVTKVSQYVSDLELGVSQS